MSVEVGHYALALALALAVIQVVLPFWGARARDAALMSIGPAAAVAVFVCVLIAFAALVKAHVTSDFSVVNVVENSHSLKPLLYKVTGVWGNHEGSMLLWILVLALFGALVAVSRRSVPEPLRTDTLAVQGVVTIAFLAFVLATSDPFARVFPAPAEGQDLNPILQDIGLAIHPPLLYVGYVGYSIVFAFAAAALIEGRIDAVWARAVRPWSLVAWIFLTLGIAMGSYWAYYELGWGGFWFWDPVENASLMPWLAGTALMHSMLVMEKRDALKVWTLLLAILTFSLSLLGTFLVRSGVLTSVHTFATDPGRGFFILCILVAFIGGGFALFAWRAPVLKQGGLFAPVSREGALVLNNLLLASACATVLIGTIYPLALEALTGDKISVGAPFFELTFLPLALALLLLVPFGQALAWKRGNLLGAAQRVVAALAIAVVGGAVTVAVTRGGPVLAVFGVGLGLFLVAAGVNEVVARSWSRGMPLSNALRRAFGLPRSAWGSAVAHAGVGVVVLGLAAQAWSVETLVTLKPGEAAQAGPFTVVLEGAFPRTGPNFNEEAARFRLIEGGAAVASVEASKRFYAARATTTTEAGIRTLGLSQVYVSLGDSRDGALGVRIYWKPFVLLIWLGAVVMALGGALSLSDRRLRLGVPVPSRRAQASLPTATPAAAE
ncbi:heme lyase CcmF/NrfE family subunit [Chelatococcus reniformis]|uniref:Cytochrome c-type biogenesis protein CycK n=1 Tax=Chelatococcus reniformis TaxID=1494448 RepID=A0A916UHU7_9HYPH|nr:heme lyase CcmF/NrfE family subunit [Chelatococcus reniformis]GGC73572.1 cytochrome c-type biogenesis protein CycK [Chelatococcus reniformis]